MSYHDYFEQERKMFHAPRITWGVQRIILASLAIFVVQLLVGPFQYLVFSGYEFSRQFPGGMLNIWFGFQPDLFLQGLVWKPFTYMFLHSGILHLGFNMIWLYFFGPDVERTLGTLPFLRFYVACGALGVLSTFAPFLLSDSTPSVIGASGAVMGVLVAFALLEPNRQFHLLFLPWPITARGLVLLVVILNIITAVPDQGGSNVSVATHFGGMGVGFAYIKLLPRLRAWRRPGAKPAAKGPDSSAGKVGEAVDNIFKFKDPNRR